MLMVRSKEDHAKPLSNRSWSEVSREVSSRNNIPGVHWFAVHCVGAPDAKVIDTIDRIKNWDVYMPTCKELRPVPKRKLTASQRNSRFPIKKPTEVPLFPRYPFVRFDLSDPLRHEVFNLLGVQGMICDGSGASPQPAYMEDAVIDALMVRQNAGGIIGATTLKQLMFDIGEQIRIRTGAFAGHNATVDEPPDVPIEQLDENSRLRLLVPLFGRQNLIELTIADIEKL